MLTYHQGARLNKKSCQTILPASMLMDIIGFQTSIVKLGPDLGSMMGLVVEELQRITGAGGAIVELAEAQLGLRLGLANSLSGLCVKTGKVLRCDDPEIDSRVDREACRKVGLRSMVVVPLFHMDNTVGVIKIISPHPNYFTEQHVCILELMSELIASFMFYSSKHELGVLYYQATHDQLTGLANRALFYDQLRQSLALARRLTTCVGVLNFDMDDLKSVNDQFGHRAGDAAIREVARRAQHVSRQSDTVARLGGDEFGVILSTVENRESLAASVERLCKSICGPFLFENIHLNIEVSIGAVIFPLDADEVDELVEKADQSMYLVKRCRKANAASACFFPVS